MPVSGFCGFGDFEAVLNLWKFRHRVPATGVLIELMGNVFLCHGRDCLSPHCREVIDMIELAPNNRLPYVNGTVVEVAATARDGETSRGPVAPTVSSELVAAESRTARICAARRLYPAGSTPLGATSAFSRSNLSVHHRAGCCQTIAIKGRVPSYYLKQLLQEAYIKTLPGVVNIDNQVHVTWPNS